MEQSVNERVKLLRSTLKLSQNEFAAKIGISAPGVWKLEAGESKPRQSTLIAICAAFGIEQNWLLNGVGELLINEPNPENKSTWKEKAFDAMEKRTEHLENEVQFLRDMLSNVTSKMSSANFNNAFDTVGLFSKKVVGSVRAAA